MVVERTEYIISETVPKNEYNEILLPKFKYKEQNLRLELNAQQNILQTLTYLQSVIGHYELERCQFYIRLSILKLNYYLSTNRTLMLLNIDKIDKT